MSRPRKPAEIIQRSNNGKEELFVSYTDATRDEVIRKASAGLSQVEGFVQKSTALNTFQNIAPGNVSIRDSMTRGDYEYTRPYERSPKNAKDSIAAAMEAYDTVGLIRNIIDMMADFASQGIGITHPSTGIDKVFQEWWKKVDGQERSERFCNNLLRLGNVLVKRHTAKLKPDDKEALRKGLAAEDLDPKKDTDRIDYQVKPNIIPWDYVYLNPLSINVMGEELAPFLGPESYIFQLTVSPNIMRKLKGISKDGLEKDILSKIPAVWKDPLTGGTKHIILDREKVRAFYYKKDDWQVWAKPLVNGIMEDINMLRKMKLADLCALDGAISHIRIWKLGSLEHKIYPNAAAISRLASMLLNNVGGGALDLLWGPELELTETSTDVYRFLGSQKYEPVLQAIYQGLGIPPQLSGGAVGGGFTNNFISLRTLIARLEYVRDVLRSFWEHEIKIFQMAMGFKQPAKLIFERMSLTDEQAEKALLIQLYDRGIISDEAVTRHFGEDFALEMQRIGREEKWRDDGKMIKRAGPFRNANYDQDLMKVALQGGMVTPKEAGLEYEDDPEKPLADKQLDVAKLQKKQPPGGGKKKNKKKGVSGQGRPKGSGDSKKRKQKQVKPKGGSKKSRADIVRSIANFAQIQAKVSSIISPIFLKSKAKANMRQLTDDEARKLEDFNFAVLCNLDEDSDISKAGLKQLVTTPLHIVQPIKELLDETVRQYTEKFGRQPTLPEKRAFQAGAVALYKADINDDGVLDNEDDDEQEYIDEQD